MIGPEHSNDGSNGTRSARPALTVMRKLFYLGLGVKRWLLAGIIGVSVSSVGLAFIIKNAFSLSLPDILPWHLEGVVIGVVGVTVLVLSMFGLYRSVAPLVFATASFEALTHTVYTRRSRGRGPRIVAIGGGTGLSVLLRGVKSYTDNLSAIVTVADDGGSSGRLRRELGVLPPGDFRNCLVAMSEDESLFRELFQYRFVQGDGLEGHSFGNLFIAAMANVTGSFEQALYESSRVLAVHGQILPATLANLRLSARLKGGTIVRGESSITEHGGAIDRIMLEPADAEAFPRAVEAIESAELIVVGPGSLYTSILPNLLVPGIAEAIRESAAMKVYVCNVATEKGETDGYGAGDHLDALQSHTFPTIVDAVVANSRPVEMGPSFLGQQVASDERLAERVLVVAEDLVDTGHPVRHDSGKLAEVLMDLYDGKRRTAFSGAKASANRVQAG